MEINDKLPDSQLLVLKQNYADDKNVVQLINTLALAKGLVEVYPYVTLGEIDAIVNRRSDFFSLVKLDLTDVEEGSMAMEYDYDVVFMKNELDSALYGVKLKGVPLIDGEIWDDYVANDEDELLKVVNVTEEKVVKVCYKFKE
jgi:hypothetical protein